MASPETVSLDVATRSDSAVLSNLLELYIHDLSAVFPHVELGPDGRFGYPRLPLYWSEPDRRFAFLIKCEGRVAGFVLAARDAADVLDIAEFFVMRRYRRSGVGRRAAFLLWDRFPGAWTVRVAEGNVGALAFWRGVVAEYTKGTASESTRSGEPNAWRVYSFQA